MRNFIKLAKFDRQLSFTGLWIPFFAIVFTFYDAQNGLKTIGTYFYFLILLIMINHLFKNKKAYLFVLFIHFTHL